MTMKSLMKWKYLLKLGENNYRIGVDEAYQLNFGIGFDRNEILKR